MVTKCLILKMEALYVFKTVVTIYQSTWYKIPEDFSLHIPSYFQQIRICASRFCCYDPEDGVSRFLALICFITLPHFVAVQEKLHCRFKVL